MENIRQRALAAVAGEHRLFEFSGLPAFVFNEPDRADCGDVIAGLFLQAALPDPVRLIYPEVPRRRPRGRFRRPLFAGDRRGRPPRAVCGWVGLVCFWGGEGGAAGEGPAKQKPTTSS